MSRSNLPEVYGTTISNPRNIISKEHNTMKTLRYINSYPWMYLKNTKINNI